MLKISIFKWLIIKLSFTYQSVTSKTITDRLPVRNQPVDQTHGHHNHLFHSPGVS